MAHTGPVLPGQYYMVEGIGKCYVDGVWIKLNTINYYNEYKVFYRYLKPNKEWSLSCEIWLKDFVKVAQLVPNETWQDYQDYLAVKRELKQAKIH